MFLNPYVTSNSLKSSKRTKKEQAFQVVVSKLWDFLRLELKSGDTLLLKGAKSVKLTFLLYLDRYFTISIQSRSHSQNL